MRLFASLRRCTAVGTSNLSTSPESDMVNLSTMMRSTSSPMGVKISNSKVRKAYSGGSCRAISSD